MSELTVNLKIILLEFNSIIFEHKNLTEFKPKPVYLLVASIVTKLDLRSYFLIPVETSQHCATNYTTSLKEEKKTYNNDFTGFL